VDERPEPLVLICPALIVVYIIFGILDETFIHLLMILSTLPSAGVGRRYGHGFVGNRDHRIVKKTASCLSTLSSQPNAQTAIVHGELRYRRDLSASNYAGGGAAR
jgi:hypothetical protein